MGPVSEVLDVFCSRQTEQPRTSIPAEIWKCSPADYVADVGASWRKDQKLIVCVISYQVTQLAWPQCISVADRQTDRPLTAAIPRFALRASRSNV